MSALGAVAVSALSPYRIDATLVLLASFLPGYLYDKFSKKHWWSNAFLSAWATLMVLTGGLYAGTLNIFTMLIAVAVGIQIFVQVIEGDLKDIEAPEQTLAERLGVKVVEIEGTAYSMESVDGRAKSACSNVCEIVEYTRRFNFTVYGLKLLEALILIAFVELTYNAEGMYGAIYYTLALVALIVFMTTVSLFLTYTFDRDEIKQKSSVHELASIVFLGLAVVGLDLNSAVLIILAPIIWYLVVNHLLHSSALNPDI
jgi:hypothetical protein